MEHLNSFLKRALLRIPAVLLALLCALAVSQSGDQVDALFRMAAFPTGYLPLFGIALASGLAVAALVSRRSTFWAVVDGALLATPIALVGWAGRFHGSAAGVLTVLVLVAAVAIYARGIASRTEPSLKVVALSAAASVLIWVVLATARTIYPIDGPRMAGTLAICFVFIGLAAVAMQLALYRPAIGALVAVPAILAFLLNEQPHRLATMPTTAKEPLASEQALVLGNVSLRESFAKWLGSRKDLDAYRSKGVPYPVFIVAAEGGGGYAAAHAFLFLSKIQRRCPNFAQHVFAIVGVSGGAVGSTMFWRSLSDDQNPLTPKPCAPVANSQDDIRMLSKDHLAPVVASLLFHDLPNRLLFGALGPRGRLDTLISSLAEGAAPGKPGNPMYFDHYWKWHSDGALQLGEKPAIIPVATNAVSGKRYVFAPFTFAYPRCRFEQGRYDLYANGGNETCPEQATAEAASENPSTGDGGQVNRPVPPKLSVDVGLFDAAVASAAFPYVTPSVLLTGWHGRSVSLVDGGYLDNSGTEAAREIVMELQDPVAEVDGLTLGLVTKPHSWAPRTGDDPTFKPTKRLYELKDENGGCGDECGTPATASDAFEFKPTVESYALRSKERRCVQRCPPQPPRDVVEFHINVITIRAEPTSQRFAEGQSFFFDPIRALDATRSQRGETARRALAGQLCGGVDCPPQVVSYNLPAIGLIESVIDTTTLTLPLGWHLPESRIRGLAEKVVPDEAQTGVDATESFFGGMQDNLENVRRIEELLAGGPG